MSKTINTGWLTDFEDVYFAPKTLFTKVLHDNSGTDLLTYLTTLENNTDNHTLVVDLGEDGSRAFSTGVLGVQGILDVPNGGTGRNSLTSHYLLIGNGTDDVTLLAPAANPTWLLASEGVSKDPAYKALTNSWIIDAAKGPSLQIEVGGAAACQAQIPIATASQSGVVIVGEQTFGGKKTFDSGIDLNNQEITNVSGIQFPDAAYYFVDAENRVVAYIDGNGIHAVNFITKDSNNVEVYDINNSFEDIYTTFGSDIKTVIKSVAGVTTLAGYLSNIRNLVNSNDSNLRNINLWVDLASDNKISIDNASSESKIGVTGVLDVPNGGTGLSSIAKHNLLVGNDNDDIALIAPLSSDDSKINTYVLANNSGATPSYKAITNSWYGGNANSLSLQISVGGVAACASQIPNASADTAGVVTTTAQTFSGKKTFQNGIDVNNTEITSIAGMQFTDASSFYFTDSNDNVIAYVDSVGVHSTNFITKNSSNIEVYNMNDDFDNIYRILGSDIDTNLNEASASTIAEYISETRSLMSSNDTNIRNISLYVDLASNDSVSVGTNANKIGVFNQLDVENGGTGRDVLTVNNLIIGAGTSKVTLLPPAGDKIHLLASNGLGKDPSYKTLVGKFRTVDKNNVTWSLYIKDTAENLSTEYQLPNATEGAPGIVTAEDQSFSGKKSFLNGLLSNGIDLNNNAITNITGYLNSDQTQFIFADNNDNVVAVIDNNGIKTLDFISNSLNGSPFYNYNSTIMDIYRILGTEVTIGSSYGGTSLQQQINNEISVRIGAINTVNNSITSNVNTLNNRITSEVDTLNNTISSNVSTLNGRITSEVDALEQSIANESALRVAADGTLQDNIDAINATKLRVNLASNDQGTVASGTFGVTGILDTENGGTGTSAAPKAGGIIYGDSTSAYGCTNAGVIGQFLMSKGTDTPVWKTLSVSLTGDVTGSGNFDSNGTLSFNTTISNSGVNAGSYGPSANATLTNGGSFSVPYVTVDADGRLSAASTITYTLPTLVNSDNKVLQTVRTTNGNFPILLRGTSAGTTTTTTSASFAAGVTVNPSTGTIGATYLNAWGLEFFPSSSAEHGGYIDFHYNASTSDYTSRIIELTSGTLTMTGNMTVTGQTNLNNKVILNDASYGTELPSSGTEGQIFFLLIE